MKKLVARIGRVRSSIALVIASTVILSAVFFTVWAEKPGKPVFERELYTAYVKSGFRNLEQVCDEFPVKQAHWIDIVPPGMSCLLQAQGIRYFDHNRFPETFVKGLVPVEKKGVTFYPISIVEHPETREYLFFNADGKEIYSVLPPIDYNPQWLALLKMPALYDGSRSKEDIEDLLWRYDSSRVAVSYDLITEKDLIDYVTQLSQPGEQEDSDGLIMRSYSGPPVTDIRFACIQSKTNGMELTIAYPNGFTNDLDIFRSETLMNNPWWDWVCTTNVSSSTNWIEWTDSSVAGLTNGRVFYVCGNADCTTATDPDGDGIPWGREKYYYHTCPTNSDTDTDSMPDGWEIEHSLNPLANDAGNDPDGDGLSNFEEYKMDTDPRDQSDGRALLETARSKIISHWHMVMTNDLSFTNTPGSAADLNDLKTALNQLSGKFYRIETP